MRSDTVVAMALGVLLLVLVLGGVVWLDLGPIRRQGRALRDRRHAQWPRTWRGRLTGSERDD